MGAIPRRKARLVYRKIKHFFCDTLEVTVISFIKSILEEYTYGKPIHKNRCAKN